MAEKVGDEFALIKLLTFLSFSFIELITTHKIITVSIRNWRETSNSRQGGKLGSREREGFLRDSGISPPPLS